MQDSILKKEISEQDEVLRRLLANEWENIQQIAAAIHEYNPRYILIAARGTSDNAARYGQYLFGARNGLQIALATPSLFTQYKQTPRLDGALVIGISQSGQSPDIVSVITEGQRQGVMTLAITNDSNSPLAKAAAYNIHLHAGEEKAVAATKTYTASLMALAMLSTALAGDEERYQALQAVPGYVTSVLNAAQETIQKAERYRYMDECVVNSRGYNYATAFEFAIKMKELTYVLAEPYSTADFQHGPVALVEQGFPVMAIVPEGILANELIDLLKEVKERGAELIVISAIDEALALAQTKLPIPAGIPEWLSPLVAIVPGQLFALGLTMAKGHNIDQPRNIHKVTLTE